MPLLQQLWGYFLFCVWVLWTLLMSIVSFFVSQRKFCGFLRFWASGMYWISGTRHQVVWHIPQNAVYSLPKAIVVSNHQSYADIPGVVLTFERRLFFLAKKEFSYLPIFGPAAKRGGLIYVDRKRRGQTRIDKPIKAVFDQSGWVYMAPEGTRSPDGRLLPFRSGPFWVAETFQVPLVVVVIKGTRPILPKHSFWIRPGHETIFHVVAVMDPAGDAEQLKIKTRNVFEKFMASTQVGIS
jgi:1-acyl-sn-glycerol-3-phosphate acyltransferase